MGITITVRKRKALLEFLLSLYPILSFPQALFKIF